MILPPYRLEGKLWSTTSVCPTIVINTVRFSELPPLNHWYIVITFNISWVRGASYHYFLSFDFRYSFYSLSADKRTDNRSEIPIQNQKPFIERKNKLNRLPPNFMDSNVSRAAFLELINRIELCRETQNNVELV